MHMYNLHEEKVQRLIPCTFVAEKIGEGAVDFG